MLQIVISKLYNRLPIHPICIWVQNRPKKWTNTWKLNLHNRHLPIWSSAHKALILIRAATIPENVTALHAGQQLVNNPFLSPWPSCSLAGSYPLLLQLRVCPINTRLQQNNQKTECKSFSLGICSRTGGRSVDTVHTTPMRNCRSIKSSFCLQLPLRPCSPNPSPYKYICQSLYTCNRTTNQQQKRQSTTHTVGIKSNNIITCPYMNPLLKCCNAYKGMLSL